jgi:hypothetical protein
MNSSTSAEATKLYLDYLDKEMTIQGILSAFCVAAAAAGFDRILGADPKNTSELIRRIQYLSSPFVLATIGAMITSALFFYLQRSRLAWLHGQISYAATCEMKLIPIPADTGDLTEGLRIGNSWSLWNCYKVGLSFLAVAVAEVGLAICFAEIGRSPGFSWWLVAGFPFAVAVITDGVIWRVMNNRDEVIADDTGKVSNFGTARKRRRRFLRAAMAANAGRKKSGAQRRD